MLVTRPDSDVCDAPNTSPALNPPIEIGYISPRNSRTPLPPEAPTNQPPLMTLIVMLPLSARAGDRPAVERSAAMTATRATSARQNLNEGILFPLMANPLRRHPHAILHRLR